MENHERPLGNSASLDSGFRLFSFLKNEVSKLITFPESRSDFRNKYSETHSGCSVAYPELVPRYQNPGGAAPVHGCREEKSMISEDDLKVSELKYRRLFETAQDAILILDGDSGKIIDANPFILDLLGYPLDYFIDKHLWELGFFKDKSLAQDAFIRLKSDGYIRYEDLPLETKTGRSISVEFVSNVYLVGDKKIIQCNIRDITALKRAEDALALANKKLNLLSSITRHDIVNKLNVLEAYFELSRSQAPNSRLQEFIGNEITTTKAIRHLINFAKDYEGMGVKSPVWQDLSSCIQKIIASLSPGKVKVTINGPEVEVFADPLFQKVFYNLIDNALRYGGDHLKTITISPEETDAGLVIAVEDDGMGINASDKEHLFKRGFGKQTGLGLFLSREILSLSGITINENGMPGKGARFEITVPKDGYRFIKKEK
jgi:PAS domain S-box-containing protein